MIVKYFNKNGKIVAKGCLLQMLQNVSEGGQKIVVLVT